MFKSKADMISMLKLRVIQQDEDLTDPIFQSEDARQLLDIYKDYYPVIGFELPWVGYMIIHKNKVVGSCGFTGAPKQGQVELAYWTFEKFEGQGIASFACKELVSIARDADPTVQVTAKTAPENNASTRILEKNGFKFKEVVQDHEIGDAWLWELKP